MARAQRPKPRCLADVAEPCCRCLIELTTAIDRRIPVVGVSLASGGYAYDFAAASAFLKSLDTELEKRNPGAAAIIVLPTPPIPAAEVAF